MEIPIQEVVKEVVDLLGAPLVAVIGGVSETRAVTQRLGNRTPQRPNVLRFALQIVTMISRSIDREMARARFEGSSPHLDDAVPALLLRDHPLAQLCRASTASMMSAWYDFKIRRIRRTSPNRNSPTNTSIRSAKSTRLRRTNSATPSSAPQTLASASSPTSAAAPASDPKGSAVRGLDEDVAGHHRAARIKRLIDRVELAHIVIER